jgi:hydroxymethylglutaryl-CoA lyase
MLSQKLKPNPILYRNIMPILTDVSLRDGLQTENAIDWSLSKKQELYHKIVTTYSPTYIEVGSFVNKKLLPIMGDTTPLFHYVNDYKRFRGNSTEHYVLIPTMNRLNEAIINNVTHLSFLTSVSNAFQKKNVNRTLTETKYELKQINELFKDLPNIRKKLYISCICECPLAGPIDIDVVLNEICQYYHQYSFDEICLSDTCGTLTFDDFTYLIESIYYFGVPKSKIGLHLHMKNRNELDQIIRYSLKNGILRFDISAIESGGCSITMKECVPNLTYDVFMSIYNKVFRDLEV